MFTPSSRWDRPTPESEESSEPIDAGVIFRNGRVEPVTLVVRGRKIRVKEVTFRWTHRFRGGLWHCFAVTDGVNLFEIGFDAEGLRWRLLKRTPLV